jgi:hypothetical protein
VTHSRSSTRVGEPAPAQRASRALREILTRNPKVKHFTVEHILNSLGDKNAGNALLFFSIPGMVPVPDAANLVGAAAGAVAGQMIVGRTEIKLPAALLKRTVPRRSLAVAINVILPVLERAEKAVRPRWSWATHVIAQRLLGFVVFLLALTIAFPFLGFDMLHAAALFIISLGLVEKDGLAIMIGIVAAIASLLLVTGLRFSSRILFTKIVSWLRTAAVRLGLNWLAAALKKLGLKWASILELKWTELLLLWDPEAPHTRVQAKPIDKVKGAVSRRAEPQEPQLMAA